MPTDNQQPANNRRNFSRVGKLLTLFGFGASTPYNSASLKKNKGGLIPGMGGMGGPNGGAQDWYSKQLQDGKDFNSQMSDWKDMVSYSPIAAAIRLITDECIQTEHSCPGTLWVEGADTDTESELNHLINVNLEMEDVIRSQFWWLISYGNNFEKLLIGPKGVHGWRKVDLDQIERIVDENRRLIGFCYKQEDPPDEQCALWGKAGEQKKLWKPWDFIHMRIMGEDRSSEYGSSLLRPASQVYKKLRMAEDQMVTYRLNMQPSRYVFMVDVGENPPTDVGTIVNDWNNYLRSNRRIDAKTNTYDHRYNPWALDDLIIIPKRKDSTTDFQKLAGDNEVPDITDVKYQLRLLAGALNVPAEFLGVEPEGGSSLNAKSPLAIQDLKFLRSIKAVRNPVMQSYDKTCRIHLALQNKDPFVPFKVKMSNISALESESQMELTSAQADLADKLIALGNNIDAPKDEWLRMIFTRFMPLPAELVDIIAIGNSMKSGENEYEPIPAGPDLDSIGGGGGGDDFGGGDESPIELPEPPTPQESKDDPRKMQRYLAECRKRRKKHFEAYFNQNRAIKRYNRTLTEAKKYTPKTLMEARKRLDEHGKALRTTLSKHPKVWSAIGRIINVTEGYYPDIYKMSEEEYGVWLKEVRGSRTGTFTNTAPRLMESAPVAPENKHEAVTSIEAARKARTKPLVG
jgi:hypothetical protein